MNQTDPDVYHCDDDDLGKLLGKLFAGGAQEVVIQHPTEGDKVVTRAQFMQLVEDLEAERKASPADRVRLNAKRRRLAERARTQFVAMMNVADVREIDVSDDSSFGYDINGEKMDIDGMIFLPVKDYPGGVTPHRGELGSFVDEMLNRNPVRVVQA